MRLSALQTVVVELVAAVPEPLTPLPADRIELALGQRLGHQRVVVDRRDVAPDRRHERLVGAGGEQHLAGAHDARVGDRRRHRRRRRAACARASARRSATPAASAACAKAVGELRRVDHRGAAAAATGRRGTAASAPPPGSASRSRSSARWPNSCKQRRGSRSSWPAWCGDDGHVELAGRLELGVDPVAVEVGAELVVVARTRAARSCRSRSGKRTRPFSIPCVSE